jgi:hypothetical protein
MEKLAGPLMRTSSGKRSKQMRRPMPLPKERLLQRERKSEVYKVIKKSSYQV